MLGHSPCWEAISGELRGWGLHMQAVACSKAAMSCGKQKLQSTMRESCLSSKQTTDLEQAADNGSYDPDMALRLHSTRGICGSDFVRLFIVS